MVCYLVRHGKDDETVRGGWCDAQLCAEGVGQVKALSKDIENLKIGRIYSSDLVRTRQTAEILNEIFQVEIQYLPQFREVDNGLLAGMKNDLPWSGIPVCFGIPWAGRKHTRRARAPGISMNGFLMHGICSRMM